ncbi:hypothetical protein SAMN04487792_1223 [Lactobacillus bombicola]|uniref:Uncharacterized protein n=1 Tax=Lactobacillus bombicola TaxID=1505723 RepID=A0A1I1SZJ6_9LACO|nr:DUF6037 family protein [Lactobacillus bombicola]SFD51751.1 hypothetical protein SAMN04487792_1223 [Lactobacillus bombicola]
MEFFKKSDLTDALKVEINSSGWMIDAKELRKFFEIEYSLTLGDTLSQFNNILNQFVPTVVNERPSKEQMELMYASLSKSDSENPNKKYCFGVKMNREGHRRSSFNDNKTRLLRPNLYKYFADGKTIIFYFSSKSIKSYLCRLTKSLISSML